jgi:purine-binding chemotaxis protein CheW
VARDGDDLWDALSRSGEQLATEEDYEHGYAREVRGDLLQYVAFRVSGETYALPITRISEISKILDSTPVPRTADFLVGIGNVRGTVLPIIGLAKRLRLRPRPRRRSTRVLIVKHDGEQYGLIVDRVHGVIALAPEELEDAPGALSGQRGNFIHALARYEGTIVIILDLSELLRAEDFLAPGVRRRRET